MDTRRFERLVLQAIEELPPAFQERMDNLDIVVEDWASPNQLIGSGIEEKESLLGLYEGIPLPDRYDYNLVLPDKITLFKKAIESICETDDEIVTEVRTTVVHEIAHHFGIDRHTHRRARVTHRVPHAPALWRFTRFRYGHAATPC